MKIEEKKLKNGAKIIGARMPGASSVMIAFGFRTGSRSESDDIAGISHFLEHMVFKGSKKRPTTEQITKAADSIGAQFNAGTGKEYTVYYIKTSKQNFELALDIVGDMVINPIFSSHELQKEKGTIIQELKRSNDNPELDIMMKIEETLYGKSSMGRDIIGFEKSIKNTTVMKIKNYYKKYYCGANCQALIAGDLPKGYQSAVKRYLDALPTGNTTRWRKIPFDTNRIKLIRKQTEQTQIGIAVPGYSICSYDRYTLRVISNILGGYMSSRLFTEIREKRGWAYRIRSYEEELTDTGYMGIFGGIKKDKAIEALQIIKNELLSFPETVTDEEITRAVENIKGSYPLQYESPEEVGHMILINSLLKNEIQMPADIVKEISKVTKKDVQRISREIFSENNIYFTVIGPFSDKKKFAKILGQ